MSFLILHASVTGKAESIASLIAEESEKRNLQFETKCMSEAKNINLKEQNCIVIVSSTTGDGEQPEKALPFLKALRSKEIKEQKLRNLKYTILGLGDSNYSEFCNGPKIIHKRLKALEATTFYDPGWADDGVGLDIVVEPWIDGLWKHLELFRKNEIKSIDKSVKAVITSEYNNISSNKVPNRFDLKVQIDAKIKNIKMEKLTKDLGSVSINGTNDDPLKKLSFPNDSTLTLPSCPVSYLKLTYNDISYKNERQDTQQPLHHLKDKELINAHVSKGIKLSNKGAIKDVYQVTLNIESDKNGSCSHLQPGDAIDIICSNPEAEVDILLERLGLLNELADKASVSASLLPDCKKSAKIPDFLPKNGELFSLKHILGNCVEIRSVPKKPLIRTLVEFTSDDLERRRLEELCSRQGGNNYLSIVRGKNICLLDILLAFPSCQPPIGKLI